MIIQFIIQVAGFSLFYCLIMGAAFPFMTIIGKPKPWQKCLEFLMSFPVDNDKIGVLSFYGIIAVAFLNSLLLGAGVIGIFRTVTFLKNLIG